MKQTRQEQNNQTTEHEWNRIAVGVFILGLCSIGFFVINQMNLFIYRSSDIQNYFASIFTSMMMSIMGVVGGVIVLRKNRSKFGIGMAIAGLIMSSIVLVLSLWFCFFPNYILMP